jgi:tetratricopeptide (TPR) repeat protein
MAPEAGVVEDPVPHSCSGVRFGLEIGVFAGMILPPPQLTSLPVLHGPTATPVGVGIFCALAEAAREITAAIISVRFLMFLPGTHRDIDPCQCCDSHVPGGSSEYWAATEGKQVTEELKILSDELRLKLRKECSYPGFDCIPASLSQDLSLARNYDFCEPRRLIHMRRLSPFVRNAGTLLAFALLLPLSFAGRNETKAPADRAEAEKWITSAIRPLYQIDQLNSQYLLLSSRRHGEQYHFGIALARIASIQSGVVRDGYYTATWQDYTHDNADYLKFFSRGRSDEFAAAIRYLASAAREEAQAQQEATLRQFQAQAKAWRNASPQPVMPEAAREHQVLAEYAYAQREVEKAMREFKAALDIFPTWPDGQFNLATMAGEHKEYDTAILHMKEYLELVPESPDTQAARDNVIVWRDRITSFLAEDKTGVQPRNASFKKTR